MVGFDPPENNYSQVNLQNYTTLGRSPPRYLFRCAPPSFSLSYYRSRMWLCTSVLPHRRERGCRKGQDEANAGYRGGETSCTRRAIDRRGHRATTCVWKHRLMSSRVQKGSAFGALAGSRLNHQQLFSNACNHFLHLAVTLVHVIHAVKDAKLSFGISCQRSGFLSGDSGGFGNVLLYPNRSLT